MVASQLYLYTVLPIFGASADTGASSFDPSVYTRIDTDGKQIIHLPAGTYRVSGTIALPSNSILEGEGEETILKAEAPFFGSQFITNADFTNGNNNIIIRNFKIELTLPLLPGAEPGILRFRNVEQLEVDNLAMVIDSPMFGIDLSAQVRSATVERCTIVNKVYGGGIMIRNGDALPARATSNIIIRNNRIVSVGDEPIAAFGW